MRLERLKDDRLNVPLYRRYRKLRHELIHDARQPLDKLTKKTFDIKAFNLEKDTKEFLNGKSIKNSDGELEVPTK